MTGVRHPSTAVMILVRRPGRTKRQSVHKEEKSMERTWLDLLRPRNQRNDVIVHGDGTGNGAMRSHWPLRAFSKMDTEKSARDNVASSQVELVRVEDIYRTAGIMNPRSGCSIGKVVKMLHNEHACKLSKEAQRAAVLMALDVAGVPIDEVLEDANARQHALDSYEAEVRKDLETAWARTAAENIQIQAELDRVKAHYMARVGRNVDGVAREKSAFNTWLKMKRQESHNISEAAELCVTSTVPAAADRSPASSSKAPTSVKRRGCHRGGLIKV